MAVQRVRLHHHRAPDIGTAGDEKVKHPEEHRAAEYNRADADKEIPQDLPRIFLVPGMFDISQRTLNGVGAEQLHFDDFVEKDDAKKGVSQLVQRRAEPGQQIETFVSEGFL